MRHLLALFLIVPLITVAQKAPQLQVTGTGRLESPPDLTVLNIELNAIRLEFTDVVAALESNYEELTKHLEAQGFSKENIKTSDYAIQQNWIYRRNIPYDSGFVGYHTLVVEFANTKENLAKTIRAFSKSPVKARLNIAFALSDSLRESIRNELIKRAIQDARQKAMLITDASGEKLGKIVKISYGRDSRGRSLLEPVYDVPATEQPHFAELTQEQIVYTVKAYSFEEEVTVTYSLK